MDDVYADWADALDGCSLGAIDFGIDAAKLDPHPPNQGEFLAHCKRFKPKNDVLRLEHKITPEQAELNRLRIAEVMKKFARTATER